MAKRTFQEKLAVEVKKRMAEKYPSNLSLASAADVDESTVRSLFSGNNISIISLKKICGALKIRTSELLSAIGE